MKNKIIGLILIIFLVGLFFIAFLVSSKKEVPQPVIQKNSYWMMLERKSGIEKLYHGVTGNIERSILSRSFNVKTGIPFKRPTPLPQKLGREYWLITAKQATPDSQETAPYFLTLDIPFTPEAPYGPSPYDECYGQCNWQLPGSFGLHGVAGDYSKLSDEDPGSSGCIRHTDEDITFLYHLFTPEIEPIPYYIEDI
jgi:hypothetical protein